MSLLHSHFLGCQFRLPKALPRYIDLDPLVLIFKLQLDKLTTPKVKPEVHATGPRRPSMNQLEAGAKEANDG